MPTNTERAERASVALAAFTATEHGYADEPAETRIVDLFANLMHLAAKECAGHPWDLALVAVWHYFEEREEEAAR